LSVGDFGRSRRVASAARQFKSLISLAQYQAILEPCVIGLKINKIGYQFYRYQTGNKNNWQPFVARIWRERKWPSQSKYRLHINNASKTDNDKIQIIIYPNGNITPFTFKLLAESSESFTIIEAKQNGDLSLREDS
jgi:Type II transport protein GspH